MSPAEILRALVRERSKTLAIGMRGVGVAVVLMLWLAANKPELELKVAFIDISVPVAYVTFALALFLFSGMLNVASYFVLNDFMRIAGNRFFGLHASPALTMLEDGTSAWSAGLLRQFRFFKSDKAHGLLGVIVAGLATIPFVVVLAAIYWTDIRVGFDVLQAHGLFSLEAVLTVVGWLLLAFPITHLVLILTPFSFTKNVGFIRWVFLFRMYRKLGLSPPRIETWLDEQRSREMQDG